MLKARKEVSAKPASVAEAEEDLERLREEATRACDTYFDLPHDGTCAKRLPPFPPPADLAPFRIGLIVGPSGAAKSALLGASGSWVAG